MSKHKPLANSRIGLRARILGVFVLVCSASLLSISLLSAGFFNGAAAQSRQQSADALKLQIQRNMEKAAIENAGLITNKLEGAAAQVELLAAHGKTLFDYPGVYGYRQSYYHDLSASPTPPTPPDRYWDSIKYGGMFVSNATSSYLVTTGNYTGDYTKVSSQLNATIQKSSSMDYMFQSVYEEYPGFHWIYMGFQIGLHRSYPWHALTPSYDPTTRTWYKTAKANSGDIIFTNPYYDASGGGLMISIARTVTMTNGTFIGVVSADLTIGTIREQILDIKLSPSGYAFLINQAKNVVAHPDSLYPNETIASLEPGIPESMFNSMVELQKGFSSFIKDGKVHYIAYAPVSASNYSMAVIVPESEVIGIVDNLTDDINAATIATTGLNFSIIVLAAVIAVVLGLLIAGKMVNPINALVNFASRLATMDIKKAQLQPDAFRIDARLESQNDEIGDLTRAFKSMVVSLQKEKDSEKNKSGNKQSKTP